MCVYINKHRWVLLGNEHIIIYHGRGLSTSSYRLPRLTPGQCASLLLALPQPLPHWTSKLLNRLMHQVAWVGRWGLVGRPFDRQEHLSSVSPSRFRPMHWTPTHWSRCCQHLSIVFSVLMKEIWRAPVDRIISLLFAIRFDTKLVHDFHQYDGPRCKSVCIVKYGITKVASRYCDICIRIPMILLWSNLLANKEFWPDKAGTCPIAKAGRWGWCASDSHQGGDVLGSCTASSFKDDKTLIYSNKNWIIFPFTVHHHYLLIQYLPLLSIDATWLCWNAFPRCGFEDCLEEHEICRRWSSKGSKHQLREDCHPTIMTHQSIQHPSIKLKKNITKYQCTTFLSFDIPKKHLKKNSILCQICHIRWSPLNFFWRQSWPWLLWPLQQVDVSFNLWRWTTAMSIQKFWAKLSSGKPLNLRGWIWMNHIYSNDKVQTSKSRSFMDS